MKDLRQSKRIRKLKWYNAIIRDMVLKAEPWGDDFNKMTEILNNLSKEVVWKRGRVLWKGWFVFCSGMFVDACKNGNMMKLMHAFFKLQGEFSRARRNWNYCQKLFGPNFYQCETVEQLFFSLTDIGVNELFARIRFSKSFKIALRKNPFYHWKVEDYRRDLIRDHVLFNVIANSALKLKALLDLRFCKGLTMDDLDPEVFAVLRNGDFSALIGRAKQTPDLVIKNQIKMMGNTIEKMKWAWLQIMSGKPVLRATYGFLPSWQLTVQLTSDGLYWSPWFNEQSTDIVQWKAFVAAKIIAFNNGLKPTPLKPFWIKRKGFNLIMPFGERYK